MHNFHVCLALTRFIDFHPNGCQCVVQVSLHSHVFTGCSLRILFQPAIFLITCPVTKHLKIQNLLVTYSVVLTVHPFVHLLIRSDKQTGMRPNKKEGSHRWFWDDYENTGKNRIDWVCFPAFEFPVDFDHCPNLVKVIWIAYGFIYGLFLFKSPCFWRM